MTVTIRVERSDGQFTIAQTEVPEDGYPYSPAKFLAAGEKIRSGFLDAYQRALDLPS